MFWYIALVKKHLAVFTKEFLKAVFSGSKTVESRFSQKKIPPFGQVSAGDLVYMKLSGEDIKGRFEVKKVIYFENLDDSDWQLLESYYQKDILGGSAEDGYFSKKRATAKYGTLIWIAKVEQFITPPITIPKKDLRGWVVLQ